MIQQYKKIVFLFFIMLLSLTIVNANIIKHGDMKIFAITTNGKGTYANLEINIIPGHGKVWSEVNSFVGNSTQQTEKTIINLAKKYYKDVDRYDYQISIKSTAKEVNGPSAGVPMALLLITMLQGIKLDDFVSGTGTITTTGEVGNVGGVYEKTKTAKENHIKLFFVPKEELEIVVKDNNVKKVNLSEYAYKKWKIKVIGITNIDEALKLIKKGYKNIKIDTSKKTEKLLYIPKPTNFNKNLDDFYKFLFDYKKEAHNKIVNSQDLLNNATLEDNDILNILFNYLTQANKLYEDGNKALNKKYLYSSANDFFQAKIYASIVEDIVKYKINDSKQLTSNINKLKQEITDYKKELDYLPYNNFEWNIAAKERLLWAEKYLQKVEVINLIDKDETSLMLSKIQLYEYAKEWYNMSKLFSNYGKKTDKQLDAKFYKKTAQKLLDEIDKKPKDIKINDLERRIYGAKTAFKNGWYMTSIFESATVLATINSYLETKDKDYKELYSKITTKMKNLENKNYGFVWYNLYFDHAKYLFNAAKFYKDNNMINEATNNLKSTNVLLSFAENLANVTEDITKNKNAILVYKINITNSKVFDTNKTINKNQIRKNNINTNMFLLLLLVLLFVIIFLIIIYRKYKFHSTYDNALDYINYQIIKIKELIIGIEKKFIKGKISAKTYQELNHKYNLELKKLKQKKQKIIDMFEDIDALESEVQYLNERLQRTNNLFRKGLIDEKEYKKRITKYKKEIIALHREVKDDETKINKNIKKIKKK